MNARGPPPQTATPARAAWFASEVEPAPEPAAGLRGGGRDWRQRRPHADPEAAMIILQDWNAAHAHSTTA